MKKLLKISFLLAVLCFAVPVYADDGDMPTGSKTCTQNCGGLTVETTPDESTFVEIYSWIYEQISELTD